MSSISEATRKRVRARAGDRCEYCLSHQDYIMGRLQVDHILPVAKGGKDTEDNLCLCCELCNQYKWTQTEGIDPETKAMFPIFNPRQQNWVEHFAWSEDGTRIVGTTTTGRATVEAL